MKNKHSKRYLSAKNNLFSTFIKKPSFIDAINFLTLNNSEKIKKVKASFFIASKKKGKIISFEKKSFSPPFWEEDKQKIVLIKEGFEPKVLEKISQTDFFIKETKIETSFLTLEEVETTLFKKKGKIKKKIIKNLKKIFINKDYFSSETGKKTIEELKKQTKLISSESFISDEKELILILEKVFNTKKEILIKPDKNGNVNLPLGTTRMTTDELLKNYQEITESINNLKPKNWKGNFIKKIVISSCMGPGIRILLTN